MRSPLIAVVAALLAVAGLPAHANAQGPTLAEVLKNASAYLVHDRSSQSFDRMYEIINQSARYNIGSIQRNVNTPVMPLQFLDAGFQSRFEFRRATRDRERSRARVSTPPSR